MLQSFVFEQRLNRVDALYCFLNKLGYSNVGMCLVAILEADVGADVVRETIRRATSEVPRFRDCLGYVPADVGPPRWVSGESINVDRQMDEWCLGARGTWQGFMDIVNLRHSAKFDDGQPPWHLTYVPDLPNRGAAIVLSVHHALSDATALTALISSVLIRETLAAAGIEIDISVAPYKAQSLRELLAFWGDAWRSTWLGARANARQLGAWHWLERELRTAREYVSGPQTWETSAHSAKRCSFLFRMPLSDWQAAAVARGGRINELYLAFAAATMRRYLAAYGCGMRGKESLRVAMPINLRDEQLAQDGGNVTGTGILALTGTQEQLADLRAISEAARLARDEREQDGATLVDDVISMLPGRLQAIATFRRFARTDVMATNVIIPFSGGINDIPATMMFMLPPVIGPPASFALTSYGGLVHIAISLDQGLVHRPRLFAELAAELLIGIVGEQSLERIGL